MTSQLSPNPLLAQLGYDSNARLVLFHTDDVGLCSGSNQAFLELSAAGIVKSGSIMMPCQWANEAVEQAIEHNFDAGIHLTLTCELSVQRWGPIAEHSPGHGLTAPDNAFWQSVEELRTHVDTEAATIEMRAQIDSACAAGLDVTHIDTHMGAAIDPLLLPTYLQFGIEYALPSLLVRHIDAAVQHRNEPNAHDADLREQIFELESNGVPFFDWFRITPCYDINPPAQPGVELYERIISAIPPGITYFSLHPNAPGDIEQLLPDLALWRTFEYKYFQSERLRRFLDAEAIIPIGMREIRTAMRQQLSTRVSC